MDTPAGGDAVDPLFDVVIHHAGSSVSIGPMSETEADRLLVGFRDDARFVRITHTDRIVAIRLERVIAIEVQPHLGPASYDMPEERRELGGGRRD
jgi:hypothetical protein